MEKINKAYIIQRTHYLDLKIKQNKFLFKDVAEYYCILTAIGQIENAISKLDIVEIDETPKYKLNYKCESCEFRVSGVCFNRSEKECLNNNFSHYLERII